MSAQPPQDINAFLQQQEVQKSIQKSMRDARSNATVTISTAAELFGFSESQLREWEKKGLVTTKRETLTQEGRGPRQYSPQELDKLAIIKVLIDEGGYSPRLIPPNVDKLWQQVVQAQQKHIPAPDKHLPIDKRVEHAEKEVFWRYFTSQALRLSLLLICEDIPDTIAGLILPLHRNFSAAGTPTPRTLSERGEVLVGWLDANRSFHTFLDSATTFEEPSDFRIQSLVSPKEYLLQEHEQDQTLIVVQRKARPLNLTTPIVETIRRLLTPIYQNVAAWQPAFDFGMRDWFYQSTDFTTNVNASDDVLNDMMDIIIHLGGKTADNQNRWRFACLLLPDDPRLPLQQHSLIVRAKSEHTPYKTGISSVSAKDPGLSFRAYQSGHMIHRQNLSPRDSIIAYQNEEQSTRSAIAVPIVGEDGLSIAVFYVASDAAHAFSAEDQRLLRLIGKMVEELLLTYQARQQAARKLVELINTPDVVDLSFMNFYSENDFIQDLETLLEAIRRNDTRENSSEKAVSFIAVDIDNQSALAAKFGDRIARNLSFEVGTRIEGYLKLFGKLKNQRIYYTHAGRYYLLLDGMPLDDARNNAAQLKVTLNDNYRIGAQRIADETTTLSEGAFELPNVTVHLGITSYTYAKLHEILQRSANDTAIAETESLILGSLDEVLAIGQRKGGDVIISWDHASWGYQPWSSPASS